MGGRGIRQRFAHVRVKLGQSVRVSTHIVEAAEALGAVGRQIAALTCAHSRFAGSTPTAVGRAACTQAHARREQHEEAYPHVHNAQNSPAGVPAGARGMASTARGEAATVLYSILLCLFVFFCPLPCCLTGCLFVRFTAV